MSEPVWITTEMAISIHEMQIKAFGGSPGLRDQRLLESALARPRNRYAYSDAADIHDLAAAYCYGIVRNHPFVDGNKRSGFVVARTFLGLNGQDFSPPVGEPTTMIRSVAAGELSEDNLADRIRRNTGFR